MRYTGAGEPGTVVVACNYLGRYSDFEASLENVTCPAGSVLIRVKSGSCAKNQNVGVAHRRGGWVWFIDDDQTFKPDVLMRLLAHNVEVVAPLCPMRFPPYGLVMYKRLDMEEHDGKVTNPVEVFYDMHDLDGVSGLIQVEGLPKSGCLVRESVWRRMPQPIFKIGLLHADELEDDKYWMWELREKYNVPLWCDTDQSIGHLTTIVIGCERNGEGKYTRSMTVC